MIFSFIISPDDDDPARIVPARLSCSTEGLIEIYTGTEIDITLPVENFNIYIASGINNQDVRWSEDYIDAFGLGKIITGSRPVYNENSEGIRTLESIISIDVLFSNISNDGIISEDDVLAFLVSNQVCEPFIVNEEIRASLQDENVCEDLNDSEATDNPEYVKLKPLWISLSVFTFLVMFFVPWFVTAHDDSRNTEKIMCWSFISVPFWLWFLCMFWIHLWDEIVENFEWTQTDATVERKEINGYRCCDIVNCQCSNTNSPSCSSLKSQLVEGTCDNGYYCCKEICYSCNYYTSCSGSGSSQSCTTYCSTCCDCVNDVSH
jgi:hypothetical protein